MPKERVIKSYRDLLEKYGFKLDHSGGSYKPGRLTAHVETNPEYSTDPISLEDNNVLYFVIGWDKNLIKDGEEAKKILFRLEELTYCGCEVCNRFAEKELKELRKRKGEVMPKSDIQTVADDGIKKLDEEETQDRK